MEQQGKQSRKHGIDKIVDQEKKHRVEEIYPTTGIYDGCVGHWKVNYIHDHDHIHVCTIEYNTRPLDGVNFLLKHKKIYISQTDEGVYHLIKIVYVMQIDDKSWHYTIHEDKKPHLRSKAGKIVKTFGYVTDEKKETKWIVSNFKTNVGLYNSVCKVWNYMVERCRNEINVDQLHTNLNCDLTGRVEDITTTVTAKKYEYKYRKYKTKYLQLINKLSKSLTL